MVFVGGDNCDVAIIGISRYSGIGSRRNGHVCVVLSDICAHLGLACLQLLCIATGDILYIAITHDIISCVNVDVARYGVKNNDRKIKKVKTIHFYAIKLCCIT